MYKELCYLPIFAAKKLMSKYMLKVNGKYLTIILNAPRGVTRTAGANAYATKFATSPTITINQKPHNSFFIHLV